MYYKGHLLHMSILFLRICPWPISFSGSSNVRATYTVLYREIGTFSSVRLMNPSRIDKW